MNNSAELSDQGGAKFLLRWRGRPEGPHTEAVIEAKLAANEIGMLHEICYRDQWITIRDFVAARDAVRRAENQAREDQARQAREEAEEQARMREEQLRSAALLEERRKNDLLAAGLERQNSGNRISARQLPAPRAHRGGLILALALIGLFILGPLCLVAWVMGSSDLREMDAGLMDAGGRSTTSSGRNIGMLGTVLWAVLVIFVFII